jgi:hypothetical protein
MTKRRKRKREESEAKMKTKGGSERQAPERTKMETEV